MNAADLLEFLKLNAIDLIAFVWFLLCYRGYFKYTKVKTKNHPTLSYAMHRYRREWVQQALLRDNRIADTNTIANLERSVSFFASTTILILAGLMTVLGSSETVYTLMKDVPFSQPMGRGEWELKIALLLILFVYAFFKFTWSLRQYGFVSVMLAGAPVFSSNSTSTDTKPYHGQVDSISTMASKAGGNFNNGLRTYYFSLAVVGWFVNVWLFILLSAIIVVVLYRREFKSATLKTLLRNLP